MDDDDDRQQVLFEMRPSWAEHWQAMPSYAHKTVTPWRSLTVNFRSLEDFQRFALLVGQPLGPMVRTLWFPAADLHPEQGGYTSKRYAAQDPANPEYPVYIVSKGRWESRMTARALDRLGVPFSIVVEPQEFDRYAEVIDPARILVLPFSNLGQGSIPARNWIWDHSISIGARRHWILDDNIGHFMRFQDNKRTSVADGTIFRLAEEFCDRYENVALAGFNYRTFVMPYCRKPPFHLNTRVYSCMLLSNEVEHRWRGRYNEDTDLSLRILKDGLCTVLFNAFLIDKTQTMTMKGGNMDELYQGDGRLQMAQSLKEQHPGIVTISEKWGRPQHHVNYRIFRGNRLRLKPGARPVDLDARYEMELRQTS